VCRGWGKKRWGVRDTVVFGRGSGRKNESIAHVWINRGDRCAVLGQKFVQSVPPIDSPLNVPRRRDRKEIPSKHKTKF